jgi:hypothetical protein
MSIKIKSLLVSACLLGIISAANAEGGKTLASTIDVYVFSKDGQKSEQQSKDEAACYEWAEESSGSDPLELQKQSAAQDAETGKAKADAANVGRGAGAKGALRGAGAGAVIGEIANDDSSDGAKIGAAVGVLKGRRKAKEARAQATEQAERQGGSEQQATTAQTDNFKKAFSVCLEAKDYLVKY